MQIKIKYSDSNMPKINFIEQGDWIDLRCIEEVEIKAGEFKLLRLGVSIKLPPGYEAHIAPRSSTFKNYGIIQTNSVAVIDESYSGNDDEWFMPVLAFRDVKINKYDRVCQFRIMEKMPRCEFVEVENLTEKNRGGHGSTGIK